MTQPSRHFRALARRTVRLPARIEQEKRSNEQTARLVDLGLGGACLELGEALAASTHIHLLIDAPHLWDPLNLQAEVRWVAPNPGGGARVGVHFENLSGTALRLLAELLEAEAYST